MKWMDFLERRFGRLGIPRLMLYIVAGKAFTYVASLGYPDFPSALVLDPQAVRSGEVWRLVTYLFLPQFGHPLMVVVQLYFTFLIGNALEAVWGPFRFTTYYLMGAVATAVLAMTPLLITATPFYVEVSLFLAFATLFPDATFMLLLVLPVKAKWLAWITAALLGVSLAAADMAGRLAIMAALANYLLFFWQLIVHRTLRLMHRGAIPGVPPPYSPKPVHKCAVCGKTELDDRDMGFRICACAECGEGREFCEVHLKEHLKGIGRA
jgi:membrane associated rhomboid family serine protease